MQRNMFQHNGLRFSYLDSGGDGKIIIALHAHWMEAKTFEPLASALMPKYRVIALDQRGMVILITLQHILVMIIYVIWKHLLLILV